MGCGSSSMSKHMPSMMLSEGAAYGKARKNAAKDLVAAHKDFYNASSAYADSLKSAGTALLIYCEGTNVFIGSALGENVPPQAFQNVAPVQVSEVSGEVAVAGNTAEYADTAASSSIAVSGSGSSRALPAPTPVPPQPVAPPPSPPPPPGGGAPPPGPGGLPPPYPYGYPPPPPSYAYPPPPYPPGQGYGASPGNSAGSPYPPAPASQGTPPSLPHSSSGSYGGPPQYAHQGTPPPPFPGYPPPGGAPPPAGGYSGGFPPPPPPGGAYGAPPPGPPSGAYGAPPPAPAGGAGGWEQQAQARIPSAHYAGNSGQLLVSSGQLGAEASAAAAAAAAAAGGGRAGIGSSGAMGGSGMLGGSGQIIAYVGPSGGAVLGDKWVDEFAKKVNAHFLEGSTRITALVELLKVGAPIPKHAVPPLTVAAATKEGGQLESIGDSIQKLVNWERDIKDKIWDLETIRNEMKSKDKKVRRETARASGNANADPRKLEGAQSKLSDVQHRLAGASEKVMAACHAVEQYKTDLLFPQLLRLLPCLVSTWHSLCQLHEQQQQLATMLANQYMPPVTHEGANTAGQVPLGPGGAQVPTTTKAQHEATKKLEDAFKKWHSSLSVLCNVQRKFFSALITWVRKTLAYPPAFPKPPLPGTAPPPGQYVASWAPGGAAGAAPPPPPPPGQQHAEGPLVALANDWVRTMDRLPEKEVKDAVMGFCGWISQAYERQTEEMRQNKHLQESLKQLSKQESKLEHLQQKERELQLSLGGPAAAGAETPAEQQAKQAKAAAAANEVANCKTALENARIKVNSERVALERLGADARAAALSGLRQGLPGVFENAGRYSGTASQAYAMLQTQHAPWLPVQV
ncbi:hypothetical protein CLOM_g15700 [Closterium sp. NIES-68]|nr:hypothetical protein CLOM_g15700 [Closterium sp. NIES-68]GJP77373.1 hypothetical protein CLOP_g7777 [Closterium sp. NIES-67]